MHLRQHPTTTPDPLTWLVTNTTLFSWRQEPQLAGGGGEGSQHQKYTRTENRRTSDASNKNIVDLAEMETWLAFD